MVGIGGLVQTLAIFLVAYAIQLLDVFVPKSRFGACRRLFFSQYVSDCKYQQTQRTDGNKYTV
ncbi:MAG: hypothetical protein IKV33_06795 [Alistipes sp.]|nr:hypothetical protein [Alistipes sp.]